MSPLEVLQLIGYSTAASLHLWIGALLFRRRRLVGKIERVLMVLALSMGAWHGSNLLVALHAMLGLGAAHWVALLRLADTAAVTSITLAYSLLLHVHLHLWADAHARPLKWTERARVYLSYIPLLFLADALPRLWLGPYAPMFEKLSNLLLPFALWATYVLGLVAVTDFLISRLPKSRSERRLMLTLAGTFVGIAALIFCVYALDLGGGTPLGLYLKTIANLGSLLPTALLAYHIYRYRYLELIIKESLIVASFAAVVLVVYLYGIRTAGEWLTARYGLRPGAVESILILLLALTASPLRRWLDRRFRQLFEREAGLYRDVVARVGAHAGRYQQLPELLRFVEERTASGLGLNRVRLVAFEAGGGDGAPPASDNAGSGGPTADSSGGVSSGNENGGKKESQKGNESNESNKSNQSNVSNESADGDAVGAGGVSMNLREPRAGLVKGGGDGWARQIFEKARAQGWEPVEGSPLLRERGFEIAYPLSRERREVGLMLVDAAPDALTYDVRGVLEILAGQVAIAIEDCRLVEENVRLERQVAQGERLAALGQMAATVAHEIKNPLSAIKSIAQVMREDEGLKGEYSRDLSLIVGEADRLNRSVTQMLSFARSAPHKDSPPRPATDVLNSVVGLFRVEAENRGVHIGTDFDRVLGDLDGPGVSALNDALSNLLLNALQATPAGGAVRIEARARGGRLTLSIEDGGPGVPADFRERIWDPFFTTKQRGTGLGLAIVRRRIGEVGGEARLADAGEEGGARFVLVLPVRPGE